MKTIPDYYFRVIELFKENFSDQEIAKIIYDEYSINLSPLIIKSKRSPDFICSVQNFQKQYEIDLVNKIVEVLKNNISSPKSDRQIRARINRKYSLRILKSEVTRLIHKYLRNRVNYNKRNSTYELLLQSDEINFQEDFIEEHLTPLKKLIGNFTGEDIITEFHDFFRSHYQPIETGNEKLDYLIKAIVKDNTITPCEEEFLEQKAIELGLDKDIIAEAKKSLHSNNPYLDNLLHIIFDDGLITNVELAFLKEKCIELNFSKSFVTKRFWVLGTIVYINHLRKVKEFDKLLSLFFLGRKINFPKLNNELWILTTLNIFQNGTISEIIQKAVLQFENEIKPYLLANFSNSLNKQKVHPSLTFQLQTENAPPAEIDYEASIIEIKAFLDLNSNYKRQDSNESPSKTEEVNNPLQEEIEKVSINNTAYNIERKNTPYLPLFYYNFNCKNGDNQIFINIGHKKYSSNVESIIIEFACSIYYTKQTMTSRETDIFIERFHNNLHLIE